MVGGPQIKIRCLRYDGMAVLQVGTEQLRWRNTPDEQDPLAKRKINCHRTVTMALMADVSTKLSRLAEVDPVSLDLARSGAERPN